MVEIDRGVPVFLQVANHVISAIENAEFAVGSRLPGENILATRFGVSRASVREALSCLQFVGYIESRRGSASVVVSTTPTGSAPLVRPNILNATYLLDLLEARLAVEPLVVAMIAGYRDPVSMRNLTRLLKGMELAVAQPSLNASTDLQVHVTLLRICRNRVLGETAERLVTLTAQRFAYSSPSNPWQMGEWPRHWLGHHEMTVRAVAERRPDLAEQGCRIHILSMLRYVVESMSLSSLEQQRVVDILALHGHTLTDVDAEFHRRSARPINDRESKTNGRHPGGESGAGHSDVSD